MFYFQTHCSTTKKYYLSNKKLLFFQQTIVRYFIKKMYYMKLILFQEYFFRNLTLRYYNLLKLFFHPIIRSHWQNKTRYTRLEQSYFHVTN